MESPTPAPTSPEQPASPQSKGEQNGNLCAACGFEAEFVPEGLIPCECQQVQYCSKDCQEFHWKTAHKKECPGSPPAPAIEEDKATTPATTATAEAPLPDKHTTTHTTLTDDGTRESSTSSSTLDKPIPEVFPDDSPCGMLQRMYSQDKSVVDDEFEAYAQAYYERKKQEREEEAQASALWAKCKAKSCPLILAGLLAQVLTILILLLVYVSMEHNEEAPSSPGSTTLPTQFASGDLPPVPQDILKHCNPYAIATDAGRKTCHEICAPAECCYMNEMNPKHCWKDNLKTCHNYRKACSVLSPLKEFNHTATHQTTTTTNSNFETTVYPNALLLWDQPELLPPAPETLLATCQAGFVWDDPLHRAETLGATTTCHEVCHVASCCWDSRLTNPADRCWTHPHCWAYSAACSFLLHQQTNTITEEQEFDEEYDSALVPLTTTAQLCDVKTFNQSLDNLLACQKACLPFECCWNSAYMDDCDDSILCEDAHEACAVLNVPLPVVDIVNGQEPSPSPSGNSYWETPTTATTTTTSAPPAPAPSPSLDDLGYSAETIRDACWNHDNAIQTPGHKTLCEQACQAGACCYNSDQPCPDYLPDDYCHKYEPCLVISLTAAQQSLTSKIETACASLDDLSDCVQLCAQGTCCYTNDPWKTCVSTHPDTVCSNYQACQVLYTGADGDDGGDKTRKLFLRQSSEG